MNDAILALVPMNEYQQARAHLFPSIESVRWFVRRNKPELVRAGALLEIAGKLKISPHAFDDVVLDVGRRSVKAAQPM